MTLKLKQKKTNSPIFDSILFKLYTWVPYVNRSQFFFGMKKTFFIIRFLNFVVLNLIHIHKDLIQLIKTKKTRKKITPARPINHVTRHNTMNFASITADRTRSNRNTSLCVSLLRVHSAD